MPIGTRIMGIGTQIMGINTQNMPIGTRAKYLLFSIELTSWLICKGFLVSIFWNIYISILLSWVTFCLFLSLIAWSINFSANSWFKVENISQKYFLGEHNHAHNLENNQPSFQCIPLLWYTFCLLLVLHIAEPVQAWYLAVWIPILEINY